MLSSPAGPSSSLLLAQQRVEPLPSPFSLGGAIVSQRVFTRLDHLSLAKAMHAFGALRCTWSKRPRRQRRGWAPPARRHVGGGTMAQDLLAAEMRFELWKPAAAGSPWGSNMTRSKPMTLRSRRRLAGPSMVFDQVGRGPERIVLALHRMITPCAAHRPFRVSIDSDGGQSMSKIVAIRDLSQSIASDRADRAPP